MSYILDALRRAEAQRERGAVPGVHAHPQTPLTAVDGAQRPGRAIWIGGTCLLVLAVAAGWFFFLRSAPREAVMPSVMVQAPVVVMAPAPAPAVAPAIVAPQAVPAAPDPVVASAPSTNAIDTGKAARAARESAKAEAKAARVAAAQARIAASPDKARPATAAASASVPAPATATAVAVTDNKPAAPPRLYTREELPGDIRSQLPQVSVTGSTYSENAAHRMLIANGQVFREGEKITADLTVEQIGAKAAVLRFKGYRYAVGY
ncbi:MAG: general secretion pathway protein GspB [Bdellovibrionales bacterium]|nr:general secretion pathway protein GspB [Ramlibacter sp.]